VILGRLTFGLLAVAVLSGLALAPFWSAARPLESLETLNGATPWGFFLRGVHALSSWGFLAGTVAHLVEVLARGTERKLSPPVWWRSVLLLPVSILALLGGFLMRGDAEAQAALAVAREIAVSIPVLGKGLAPLLLGVPGGDLAAVALHHAGTFTLLTWLLTAEHGRALAPDLRSTVLAALGSFAAAGILPVALGPAAAPDGAMLLGPWYLLGLQGALLHLPVPVGWAAPCLLVLAVGAARHLEGRARAALLAFGAAWGAAYVAFTVRMLLAAR
jgi:hypothetical protein